MMIFLRGEEKIESGWEQLRLVKRKFIPLEIMKFLFTYDENLRIIAIDRCDMYT